MDIEYINYLKPQNRVYIKFLKQSASAFIIYLFHFESVFYTYRDPIFLQSYEVYTIIFNIEHFDDYGGGCRFFNADIPFNVNVHFCYKGNNNISVKNLY